MLMMDSSRAIVLGVGDRCTFAGTPRVISAPTEVMSFLRCRHSPPALAMYAILPDASTEAVARGAGNGIFRRLCDDSIGTEVLG